MNIGLAFWILMLIWIVFGAWSSWPLTARGPLVNSLLLWVLLAFLGWHDFGPPLHQ